MALNAQLPTLLFPPVFNRIILHKRNNTTVFQQLTDFSHVAIKPRAGCSYTILLKFLPVSRKFFLFYIIFHFLIAGHKIHDSLPGVLALKQDLIDLVRDWKVYPVFL